MNKNRLGWVGKLANVYNYIYFKFILRFRTTQELISINKLGKKSYAPIARGAILTKIYFIHKKIVNISNTYEEIY